MKLLTLLLSLGMICPFLLGQQKFEFDYEIDSDAFESKRKFYVHVHEDYYLNEVDSFGVIYVLDAQATSFYNNAKSIIDYLVWSYQIAPVIVVGIHSESRFKEFVPLNRSLPEDDPDNFWEAEKLRAHLEQEIFPRVKRDFRVTEFRAIIGHSRGGAFLASTLFSEKRNLFHAYLAISPGMNYIDGQILKDAQKMIQARTAFHKFYFCSHGTVGSVEGYMKPQVEFLDSLFGAHPNPSIEWHKAVFPGKSHWGVVAPSVAEGILAMNRAYQVDQLLIEKFARNEGQAMGEQIKAYTNRQQERLGYTLKLDADRLRGYGDGFSDQENYPRAMELYDLSLELEPNDVSSYLRKASVYRELKKPEKAEATYQKALEILDSNEDQLDEETVKKSRERIMQKLENMKNE